MLAGMSLHSLAVFLGSSLGADPAWARLARETGRELARRGVQVVYGGGGLGLMGELAAGALEEGGRVVGVIPDDMLRREWGRADLTELHVVGSMHERKAMMAERADAFLALPGGLGTLEEIFEVWTWRVIGYHRKPVGFLDVGWLLDAVAGRRTPPRGGRLRRAGRTGRPGGRPHPHGRAGRARGATALGRPRAPTGHLRREEARRVSRSWRSSA